MEIAKCIGLKFWKEIIYLVFTSIYLILLNILNNTLLAKYLKNEYFAILSHNNFEPLIYFVFAIIFFMIGLILIVLRIRELRSEDLEGIEFLLILCSIIILIIMMILIIVFINNPILRAILGVIFSIGLLTMKE